MSFVSAWHPQLERLVVDLPPYERARFFANIIIASLPLLQAREVHFGVGGVVGDTCVSLLVSSGLSWAKSKRRRFGATELPGMPYRSRVRAALMQQGASLCDYRR
jgi:hypothetical protein